MFRNREKLQIKTKPLKIQSNLGLPTNQPMEEDVRMDVEEDNANEASVLQIPSWINCMRPVQEPIPEDEEVIPTCFFGPLKMCRGDRLTNGFCDLHLAMLFNGVAHRVSYMYRKDESNLVMTKRAMVAREPMSVVKKCIRPIVPIIELFDRPPPIHKIHLGNFNDMPNEMWVAHVQFFCTLMNMFSNMETCPTTQHYVHYTMWIKYISKRLQQFPCRMHFYMRDGILDVNECSAFTQAVFRLFSVAYTVLPHDGRSMIVKPAVAGCYVRQYLTYNSILVPFGTSSQHNCIGTELTISATSDRSQSIFSDSYKNNLNMMISLELKPNEQTNRIRLQSRQLVDQTIENTKKQQSAGGNNSAFDTVNVPNATGGSGGGISIPSNFF